MCLGYVNSYDLGGKNRHGCQTVLTGELVIDLLLATTISHPSLQLQVQGTCAPTRTQVGYCKSVRFQIHQLVYSLLLHFPFLFVVILVYFFLRKSGLDRNRNAKALRIGANPI